MGCGSSKVQPDVSMKACVSVVQTLVAFSKARGDDSEPRKHPGKRRGWWFSTNAHTLQPESNSPEQTPGEGRRQVKAACYKDRFDSRVTARQGTGIYKLKDEKIDFVVNISKTFHFLAKPMLSRACKLPFSQPRSIGSRKQGEIDWNIHGNFLC